MSTNQPFDLTNPGDLNGDGRTDSTFTAAFDADGDGSKESVAGDVNLDGEIDSTYSDLDGDGYQETTLVDSNLDGTLDTVWVDLDGDLMPDVTEAIPSGPFATADTGVGVNVGFESADPESVYDVSSTDVWTEGDGSLISTGGDTSVISTGGDAWVSTGGDTFADPFANTGVGTDDSFTTGVSSGAYDTGTAMYDSAYDGSGDDGTAYTSAADPGIDTSGLTEASWDSWNLSSDYETSSWEAWNAGDYDTSQVMTDISGDWADYSQATDYLAYDPTDASSWDAAYDSANQASWDNWNASVDAYVAGDSEASYAYQQASIESTSVADATWDAGYEATSTSYDDGSGY